MAQVLIKVYFILMATMIVVINIYGLIKIREKIQYEKEKQRLLRRARDEYISDELITDDDIIESIKELRDIVSDVDAAINPHTFEILFDLEEMAEERGLKIE